MAFAEILEKVFSEEKIFADRSQLCLFETFYDLLISENEKMNLTAITEPEAVAKKHFADSLLPLKTGYFTENKTCLDVGTGAGFPGLPLAIMCKNTDFLLIDSLSKRISFVEKAVAVLGLENVKTEKTRAEEFILNNPENREKFDVVTSRAVAPLQVLSELCIPSVKVGGVFLPLKSLDAKNEIAVSKNAVKTLGGEIIEIFGDDERNVIIIEKKEKTPEKYPRRNGVAKKRPIK